MNETLDNAVKKDKDLLYKQVTDYPVELEEAVRILHKFGCLKSHGIPTSEIEQAIDDVYFKHRDYWLKHKEEHSCK
jgi:hypothetical protein